MENAKPRRGSRLAGVPSRRVAGAPLTSKLSRQVYAHFSAVAAAAEGLRTEEADAAVGVTERAVDEDFSLHAGVAGDIVDFLQRQFAGQHNALEAHVTQRFGSGAVVHGELGGWRGVQGRESGGAQRGRCPSPE